MVVQKYNSPNAGSWHTLLLIKLWSAITLRMREERYITSIISFVLTAKRKLPSKDKVEENKLSRKN